ncbi:hypothetical protein CYMTET_26843 [Cymbomonas tetramitiformis]|uniref:Uncharacterized protein n=1 Tax=Cymbomonas tetramitiformis TaxID=36881 RepID=A0AAE0FRM1_9CHLO|nr:hypothetical protein CYMTET_26843 [Cymbomonas tetramitiformis]
MGWAGEKQFRWPPRQENELQLADWPLPYRRCYDVLLQTSVLVFDSLAQNYREKQLLLPEALKRYPGQAQEEMVTQAGSISQAQKAYFSASFMNIFNYDYGYLGPHKDRCLITTIRRLPFVKSELARDSEDVARKSFSASPTHTHRKRLWIWNDIAGVWKDIDAMLLEESSSLDLVLFVGEELESITQGWLPAVKHAVCEDPNLIEENQLGEGGCLSTALVLSSSDISEVVEKAR